jgi:predicted ATPase
MSHQDSFELSDAELPLAIDICQRLDGIPWRSNWWPRRSSASACRDCWCK